ncbi:MAG: metal-dependent transcriptional regulator [Chitinophagales bacterium]
MNNKEFHTFREYMKKEDTLTASMEDYLEMIYRLSPTGFTRIHELAAALNVQPPSATKMVQKLAEMGFADYEKYGMVVLSKKGKKVGRILMERHQTVEDFLNLLGVTDGLLEETEKIEHTISPQTLQGLRKILNLFSLQPELIEKLKD